VIGSISLWSQLFPWFWRSAIRSPPGPQQLEEPSELPESLGGEGGGSVPVVTSVPKDISPVGWETAMAAVNEFQNQMDHAIETGPAQHMELRASQRMVGIGNGDLSGERGGKLRNVCGVR